MAPRIPRFTCVVVPKEPRPASTAPTCLDRKYLKVNAAKSSNSSGRGVLLHKTPVLQGRTSTGARKNDNARALSLTLLIKQGFSVTSFSGGDNARRLGVAHYAGMAVAGLTCLADVSSYGWRRARHPPKICQRRVREDRNEIRFFTARRWQSALAASDRPPNHQDIFREE